MKTVESAAGSHQVSVPVTRGQSLVRAARRLWPVLIPLGVFVLHALLFGRWIIDDAAISYVYARNLATGHGLIAQLGDAPVEGYSNFTWVLLLTPFFALRSFDPVITAKLLSLGLIALTFAVIYHAFDYRRSVLAALVLVSLNTSFVMWGVSGLENPLNAFLAALLLYAALKDRPALAGLAAALLAMTRPDGLAYALVFPALLLIRGVSRRGMGRYLLAFAVPFGLFLGFRYATFGAWLPNTASAKGTITLSQAIKLLPLSLSYGGVAGLVLLLALPLVSLLALVRRQLDRPLLIVLMFATCSLAIFVLLPLDWMMEFRFATNATLFLALLLALLVERIAGARVGRMVALVTLLLVTPFYVARSTALAAAPDISFQAVQTASAAISAYADAAGLTDASVLAADAGGVLYDGRLRLVDLAGLIDPVIARTLPDPNGDHAAFYDYVFDIARPDLIFVRGFWVYRARLYDDPRFHAQYTPVIACDDAYMWNIHSVRVPAGLWVRADLSPLPVPDAVIDRLWGLVGCAP